jgi:hypothetical protein
MKPGQRPSAAREGVMNAAPWTILVPWGVFFNKPTAPC